MTLIETTRPTPQARQAEQRRAWRLELWRLRGSAASAAGQPRALPALSRAIDNGMRQAIAAAWLRGYDGR